MKSQGNHIVIILLTAVLNGQVATPLLIAALAVLVFGAVLLILPSKTVQRHL